MKSFRTISILFYKHAKDIFKNLHVLILFFVFPIIGFVMGNAIPEAAGNKLMFLSIFATMHCVFAPLSATACVLAEEKEKNTLRSLILSNVTMPEYLIAIGCFITFITLLTGGSFLLMDKTILEHSAVFLVSMLMGCLISTSFGMCVGLYVKNMASANGLAVPIGMVLSFAPMLAAFNDSILKVSRFTYGQQINFFLRDLEIAPSGLGITAINLAVLLIIGILLYRKVRLEE